MIENKGNIPELTKKDIRSIYMRSTLLLGSFNFERMQSMGFCVAMIPAIKRFYKTKEDQSAALKRHLGGIKMDIFLISQLMYIAHNTKEESTERE